MEEIMMNIIMHAGNARTCYLKALQYANAYDFEKAQIEMNLGKESATLAHRSQTSLIQDEAKGNQTVVSLFMVHAQDHLMNALTIRDLVELSIESIRRIHSELETLKNSHLIKEEELS